MHVFEPPYFFPVSSCVAGIPCVALCGPLSVSCLLFILIWWSLGMSPHMPCSKEELSGYGDGCFTKKKKRVFCFFCFPPRFWPFLAAGWCFFMFFCVFFVFHGGIRYKRILWYQGSIVFLNIFAIPCFSDVFWQSVFLFFFPHA